MSNKGTPNLSQATPEEDSWLDEILLKVAWTVEGPSGSVDIAKAKAAILSKLIKGRISELNHLDHDPQMFGDWQQVIEDRLADLEAQLPKKDNK